MKLKTFRYAFIKSISSLTYYQDVLNAKFSFSLKYFLSFSLFLGLVLTVMTSSFVLPALSRFVNRFESRAQNLYPQDLVITLKDGEVSTNVAEPLRFPIPYELFVDTPGAVSDQNQEYMVTIDTKANAEDYAASKSIILVTHDSLVVGDQQGGYRVYPLNEAEDMTINKVEVTKFIERLKPILRILPIVTSVGLFFVFVIVLPLSRLISLLMYSVVLWLATKLLQLPLSYGKTYQIGLHALTLPTLIQIAMTAFGFASPIPFFNSILFILYGLVILAELKKVNQVKPEVNKS